MMNLIIDGKNLGDCTGYRRRGDKVPYLDAWVFYMAPGYKITVELMQIKSFTSSGPLEITLFH